MANIIENELIGNFCNSKGDDNLYSAVIIGLKGGK